MFINNLRLIDNILRNGSPEPSCSQSLYDFCKSVLRVEPQASSLSGSFNPETDANSAADSALLLEELFLVPTEDGAKFLLLTAL